MTLAILRLLVCLLLALSVAAGGHAKAAPTALKFVAESFPPFTYEENGKGAGPMVDVVQAVCAAAALHCDVTVLPWRRILKLAETGSFDGICIAARIPERERMFYLTDDVAQSSLAFFARTGSRFKYSNPGDLNGLTIGVYGPSGTAAALSDLTKNTNAQTELEVDNLTALRKLAAGRYGANGAALINRDVGLDLIKENGVTGIAPAGEAKIIIYALGLSRVTINPQQAEQFNATLRALKHAGTVKAILQKYGITAAQ